MEDIPVFGGRNQSSWWHSGAWCDASSWQNSWSQTGWDQWPKVEGHFPPLGSEQDEVDDMERVSLGAGVQRPAAAPKRKSRVKAKAVAKASGKAKAKSKAKAKACAKAVPKKVAKPGAKRPKAPKGTKAAPAPATFYGNCKIHVSFSKCGYRVFMPQQNHVDKCVKWGDDYEEAWRKVSDCHR